MSLEELLSGSLDADLEEYWKNERTATPSRVAVDETAVKINGEWSWLYAAIDIESKLILDVALFDRHGTDPAAAFLQKLREKYDLSDAEFLVDQFGYRIALSRLGLSSRQASASGLNSSCSTTISRDRINHSTELRS